MNKSKEMTNKTIVAIGIGAAVFIILARFASIPTFIPNTEIEIVYAFLALMSVIFGPIAGLAIGLIGHSLKDLIAYGMPWFSWAIASGVVGLVIGLAKSKINIEEGNFGKKQILIFNIYQIIANAAAWFVVAPLLDIIIYSEPAKKVFIQGAIAGISNILCVAVLGTILLAGYAKTKVKSGSLSKED